MGYVSVLQPLNLKLSLTMGQAFRWQSRDDGWYSGVLEGKVVHIRETGGGLDYRVGGHIRRRRSTRLAKWRSDEPGRRGQGTAVRTDRQTRTWMLAGQ